MLVSFLDRTSIWQNISQVPGSSDSSYSISYATWVSHGLWFVRVMIGLPCMILTTRWNRMCRVTWCVMGSVTQWGKMPCYCIGMCRIQVPVYIDKYDNYMSLNYVHKFYRLISIGRDEEMKRWREGQNFNSCHWSYTSTSVWHVLSFAFLVLSSHVWQCPLSYHDYFLFTLWLHRKSSCTSSWWKSQAKLGSAQRSGRGRASCSIIDS